MQMTEPLVKVDNLSVKFNVGSTGFWGRKGKWLSAVENVSLHLDPGEVLGLVGESGSGKTTTGRAILRRVPIASGTVTFKGQDITHVKGETLRNLRRNMQAVFQDPYDSLNPNQSVLEIIAEPLLVHGLIKNIKEARPEVKEFLDLVGMPTDAVDRYPHAFSGGQRQRIGVARAPCPQA